jgi:hypothetical protein
MNTLTNEAMWDSLTDMGVSEETLRIITSINGYKRETFTDVLYACSGYRSFDQLEGEEDTEDHS